MSRMLFWRLFVKESRSLLPAVAILAALVLIWHVFLLSRLYVWTADLVLSLGLMPAFVLPVWTLGMMVYSLHTEWSTNSIYQLLVLPLRGWKVAGAKLAAVLAGLSALLVFSLASYWLFFGRHFLGMIAGVSVIPLQWLGEAGLLLLLAYWAVTAVMVVLAQFSYLAGRVVPKFGWLAAGAAFFVSLWLMMRLGTLLAPLFAWVPDLSYRAWIVMDSVARMNMVTVSSAPLVVVTLLTGAFFLLTSWLIEREVEV